MSTRMDLDVLIVGAGFAGLYQLYTLRKDGYNCKVIDSAPGIGGTWYWNTYPGARTDTPVEDYSFGFGDLYKDWTWKERYPGRDEILSYFHYIDGKLDLSRDAVLNTGLKHAEFDTNASRWNVVLTTGETCYCRFLIMCSGTNTNRHRPAFKGLGSYQGIAHHTGDWPQEGINAAGKKVAVIGTGASGLQAIQQLGTEASHLTVFQRTPNLCLPMRQVKLTEESQQAYKKDGTYDEMYRSRPTNFAGFHYEFLPGKGADVTPEERRKVLEELWIKGGFRPWLGAYLDVFFNKEVNDSIYFFWAEKSRQRITDPKKKDILAPLLENAHHTFGTKRPSLEQNFFEICNQDNVDIIDIKENPIDCFTQKGIKMSNGDEHQFDIVVLATGYDALSGAVTGVDIVGTDGKNFHDTWKDGIRTYLGVTASKFPNLFITYGAQAPTAFANGVLMAEFHGEYVKDAIKYVTKHNFSTMEATAEAQDGWTNHIRDLAASSLFLATNSWYVGANIPGKKKEMAVYLGGVPAFMSELYQARDDGWKGFAFDGYKSSGGNSEKTVDV